LSAATGRRLRRQMRNTEATVRRLPRLTRGMTTSRKSLTRSDAVGQDLPAVLLVLPGSRRQRDEMECSLVVSGVEAGQVFEFCTPNCWSDAHPGVTMTVYGNGGWSRKTVRG
jgi:hypothetical protein